MSVPVHAFKEMYACVRAYTQSGQTAETCQSIAQVSKQNAYKTTVYEFDANAGDWDDIKTVIYFFLTIIFRIQSCFMYNAKT